MFSAGSRVHGGACETRVWTACGTPVEPRRLQGSRVQDLMRGGGDGHRRGRVLRQGRGIFLGKPSSMTENYDKEIIGNYRKNIGQLRFFLSCFDNY